MEQFQFSALTESLVKVLNREGTELQVELPRSIIVAGLEYYTFQKKKHFFLRLEVPEEFATTVQTFEQMILHKFNTEDGTEYQLKSQVTVHPFKEPVLKVKIKQSFRKFTTTLTKDGTEVSLYTVQPYDEVRGVLTANVYKQEGTTLVVKWSCHSLRIIG